MKTLVAGIAVLAFLYLVANAEADPSTLANIGLGADLTSLDITPSQKQFAASDLDNTSDAVDKDVEASIKETYKFAESNLTGSAHASIGDLGIKFSGTASTEHAKPPLGGSSSNVVYRVFGQALWSDVVRLDLHNSSAIVPEIIHANLSIAGGFAYRAAGDDPGGFSAEFYLNDLSSNSGFPATLPPPPFGTDAQGPKWGFAITSNIQQPPHLIPVTLVAFNHQDVEFVYLMSVRADSSTGIGDLIIGGDFSGSLHWAGIESVTDQAGNIIPASEWSLTSTSGFDYTRPFGVPEPTSVVLVTIALYGGWLSRRGHSRTR